MENTNLFGNSCRSYFVVSGNHHGPDSGSLRIRHSLFGFFSRRIHHGCQTYEGKIILIIKGKRIVLLYFFNSKSQNTQTIFREMLVSRYHFYLLLSFPVLRSLS